MILPGMMFMTARVGQDLGPLWLWVGVLVIAVLVLFTLVLAARKRWFHESEQADDAPPFMLSELRSMHDRGELTDEQYERARERIIGMTAPAADDPDQVVRASELTADPPEPTEAPAEENSEPPQEDSPPSDR